MMKGTLEKRWFSKLKGSSLKSVFSLSGANASVQLLYLLTLPILSRLYDLEAFASYGVFIAISSILSIVSTGRLEYSVMLAKGRAAALTSVYMVSSFALFCSLSLCVLFICVDLVISQFNAYDFVLLLASSMLLGGIFRSAYNWHNRLGNYNLIAITRVLGGLGNISVAILCAQISIDSGLMLGVLASLLINAVLLCWFLPRSRSFSLKKIELVFLKYINFPKLSLVASINNTGCLQAPVLFMPILYGESVLGSVAFGMRVVTAPLYILATAVGDVFKAKLRPIAHDPRQYRYWTLRYLIALTVTGVVPFTTLFLYAEHGFQLVFGDIWGEAGRFVEVLSICYFLAFVVSPVSQLLPMMQKQKLELLISVIGIVSVAIAIVAWVYFDFSPLQALICYSLAMVLRYIVELGFVLYLVSVRVPKVGDLT